MGLEYNAICRSTHHDGQDHYGERSLFGTLNSEIYEERVLSPTEVVARVVARGPFAADYQGSRHACRDLASMAHRFLGGAFLEAGRETFDA